MFSEQIGAGKKMIGEQKLIPLLHQTPARWLSMGHKDILDSDGFTDDRENLSDSE